VAVSIASMTGSVDNEFNPSVDIRKMRAQ
jgi:hypothetical protein